MVKRVFIVHGWGGNPDVGWFKWISSELSNKGFEVHAARMPCPDNPKIAPWVSHLTKLVSKPDKDTYFIGHSIGCQAILRYLEKLPEDVKIGGAIFVAGWLNLRNLETKEERDIAKSWLESKINLNKVKNKIGKLVALFSDNDPYVPLEDNLIFKEKLGAKIIIEKSKGHYTETETLKIPVLLKEFIKLSK
jgi:hypothetical protein